jgi:alpha-N-acetylglucosamine transferase
MAKSGNRLAFVFYATNGDYAIAVMVFVHLLRDLGIRQDADVIVLHLPLAPLILEKMRRMGLLTRLVEPLDNVRHQHYRHSLVKLRVLELAEYDRVLFTDADAIPLNSLDDLLSLPLTDPIAAPRAYWLQQPYWTSALLVVQPSIARWNRIKRHFETASQRNAYDMDLINREFSGEIQSLPPATFCLNSEWEEANRPGFFADPVEAHARVSVVHFTALGKPWTYSTGDVRRLRPNAHPLFYDLWDKWRAAREALLR